ncbi:MAG: CDP-alcohol phosphatidyltransferase family protein [Actinomycetota bacterium]|nr:CDP-alcohol phosphatidyltransferase family protein [Actinomycetota bacterium]
MGRSAPFGRGRIRRLFGLDRSGAEPAPTRSGQPLRPFTLPNLVGYVRIVGIVAFLVIAFGSDDGREPAAALIFFLVSAGDYLDGLLARVTGQYSRLGALMDPVIDRATILAGVVVCWHFGLLPHWMLVLLALRELVTLLLARWGLSHGVDIEVNWFGRLGVFPVMGALFLALVVDGWVPTVMLGVGIAFGAIATILYARVGRDQVRAAADSAQG